MAAGTSAECFDTEEQQLHEVIRACILHFDASSVVRLCSASKALTETCKTELTAGKKEVAHLVLQKTVNYATALAGEDKMGIYGFTRHKGSAQITANEQAQAPQHQQLVQHMQAVTWLLRTVGTDALFIQTTPSSNKTVNDTIPKLVKLCTEVTTSELSAAALFSLMFLTIHAPDQASRVMGKAAFHPAAQQLDPAALSKLLHAAVQQELKDASSTSTLCDYSALAGHLGVIAYLSHLPGASGLNSDALASLLQGPVRISHWKLVECLCTALPAKQQLTAPEVRSLLEVAMDRALHALQAGQQLQDSGCSAPSAFSTERIVRLLCALPAAQEAADAAFLGDMLIAVVRAAAEAPRPAATGIVMHLCGLRTAMQLDVAVVAHLLWVAVAGGNDDLVGALMNGLSLRQLDAAAVEGLLAHAMLCAVALNKPIWSTTWSKAPRDVIVFRLFKLPAVRQLSAASASRLWQMAAAGGSGLKSVAAVLHSSADNGSVSLICS